MRTLTLGILAGIVGLVYSSAAAQGNVSTFAGGGADSSNGVPATTAYIESPQGIAVDLAGNVYFADNEDAIVRRIDALTGLITTIAGTGVEGNDGDGGPAIDARLSVPLAVAVDLSGNVYVVDQLTNRVRRIEAATGNIEAFAGGSFGFGGDGGPATSAALLFPEGVAVAPNGDVFIADTGNARIRKVDAATGIISTIAGTDDFESSGDGGLAINASFANPRRLAVDFANNIYVVDDGPEGLIRRIDAATGMIDTVVGGGSDDGSSGVATAIDLDHPTDVAVDDDGNLYIATGEGRAWKANVAANSIEPFAGTGIEGFSGDGGPATDAQFRFMGGIAVAGNGDVYISDSGNQRVRKIAADTPVPFDVIVELDTDQATLDLLTIVPGSVIMVDIDGRPLLAIPNLTQIGGGLSIINNPGLFEIQLPLLETVGGSLVIQDNPGLFAVDTSGLAEVGGDLVIVDNGASFEVATGTTTVGGSLAVETGGQFAVDTTGITATEDVMIDTTNASTVSALTGGESTSVTMVNGAVTMSALLPAGAFTSPVLFSIEHDPTLEPGEGTGANGTPVAIDPLGGYRFTFAVPELNADATLTFDVELAALPQDLREAFLDAVSDGTGTLAVRGETPASEFQAFDVCETPGGTVPLTDGGCVEVQRLDAAGEPLTDPLAEPAIIRLSGLVGHFSTWAVVIATPLDGPPVISGVPETVTVTATSAAGAAVTYAAPTATDDVDGPVAVVCTPASGSTFPIGETTVTCSATDSSGNTATATFQVNVTEPPSGGGYSFDGFYWPLVNPPAVNVTYAGLVVPVRWGLTGADGRRVLDRDTFAGLHSQQVACTTGEPLGAPVKAAGILLRDPFARGFTFLWITGRSWKGTCRLMTLELADGQLQHALLRFK